MRSRAAPIECLLSDCDGVIVDSEVIAETIMLEVLRQAFGVSDLGLQMHDMFGQHVLDIIRIVETRVDRPQTDARRAEVQHIIDARVAEAAAPMPETLETYRMLGLPVGVVSNSAFHRLHRSVERAGMLPLAGAHVYSAEDVGRPKPAPDAYLYAAGRMGFAPEACVVIEDSPTGVRAGCSAGMRVLGFLGGSHIRDGHAELLMAAGADAVFERMSQLPGLLAHLNTDPD